MSDQAGTRSDTTPEHYPAGIEDVVILPLVANALAVRKILRGLLTLLIRVIDFLLPILLSLMRLPLFTLRILGDGIVRPPQLNELLTDHQRPCHCLMKRGVGGDNGQPQLHLPQHAAPD